MTYNYSRKDLVIFLRTVAQECDTRSTEGQWTVNADLLREAATMLETPKSEESTMIVIGYIIHYEGERNAGAFVSGFGRWSDIVRSMIRARPNAAVVITPVDKTPEWVSQ